MQTGPAGLEDRPSYGGTRGASRPGRNLRSARPVEYSRFIPQGKLEAKSEGSLPRIRSGKCGNSKCLGCGPGARPWCL